MMKVLYREGICLQILFFLFKCSNVKQKNSFFHELIVPWFTIGDVSVTDIFGFCKETNGQRMKTVLSQQHVTNRNKNSND